MVDVMNPGRIVDLTIMIDTNILSRSSESEEGRWEQILVCIFTAVWQKIQCSDRLHNTHECKDHAPERKHNDRLFRWNNIVSNLGSSNAG